MVEQQTLDEVGRRNLDNLCREREYFISSLPKSHVAVSKIVTKSYIFDNASFLEDHNQYNVQTKGWWDRTHLYDRKHNEDPSLRLLHCVQATYTKYINKFIEELKKQEYISIHTIHGAIFNITSDKNLKMYKEEIDEFFARKIVELNEQKIISVNEYIQREKALDDRISEYKESSLKLAQETQKEVDRLRKAQRDSEKAKQDCEKAMEKLEKAKQDFENKVDQVSKIKQYLELKKDLGF